MRAGGQAPRRAVHALRDRAGVPGGGDRAGIGARLAAHLTPQIARLCVARLAGCAGRPLLTGVATRRPPKEPAPLRAADALMECLKHEGVDVVFGLPGGANLPTYDALYDAGIRHILVRHEAGGGHAAEGYAKATGRVGVAFGTSGPGATNLVTPICDAMMDSVPTVFVTGE